MSKTVMKPGCMMAPLPAALVSCADKSGNANLITVAWTGITNSEPPMAYVSVRPERFSHHMIEETGEFVINLTTKKMAKGTDFCGVRSGKDTDKWKETGFTKEKAALVGCPVVAESPVSLECKVKEVLSLGSHDMFLAEIVAVDAENRFFDESGRFDLNAAGLMSYMHGSYVEPGSPIGSFGFSVRKKPARKKPDQKKTARKKPGQKKTELKKLVRKRTVPGKTAAAGKPETGSRKQAAGPQSGRQRSRRPEKGEKE